MSDARTRIIRLLARDAFEEREVLLASGKRSGVYLDAKAVTYHPDGVEAVGEAVVERLLPYDVEAVGGLTIGADAIVSAVIHAANRRGLRIPGFIVRKEHKRHGLGKQIEGVRPGEGQRVAVVDDVVTSGGSVLKAVDALEAAGVEVAVVVALIDREEGGREAIEARGIPLEPVCTLSEVRDVAKGGLAVR